MSFLPFKRTNQPPSLSKNSNKITHYYCNLSYNRILGLRRSQYQRSYIRRPRPATQPVFIH